jgi:hypothetical protein
MANKGQGHGKRGIVVRVSEGHGQGKKETEIQ